MGETRATSLVIDTEGDERSQERYVGRLEAVLWLDGEPWRCWIRDISLGGVGLEPAVTAALGREVTLTSPHFDFDGALTGRVVNVAHQHTCMALELDRAMEEKLTVFLVANVEPS